MGSALRSSVLGERPVLLLWIARVASAVGFQMLGVAVGWQIYDLTANPLDLGLVGLVQFVPALLFTLVAGHIADRYDRRTVLRGAQLAEGAAAALLATITLTGTVSIPLIFAAVFVLGGARAFEATTLQTILPAIVAPGLLPRAVAAIASAQQTATIAGPALGGFLYILGPGFVYTLGCALFLCASTCVVFIAMARAAPVREPINMAVLFAGFGYIRRNPIVLGAITLDMFAVLLGGATALLPIFARDIFRVGPWGLGLLRAAPAIGALLMSLVLTRLPLRRRVGRLMYGAVAVYGAATVVFGVSTSFTLSMIALAVVGAADMISVVIRQTLVQIETPDPMRGRVSAVNSLFVGASNQLGDFRSGLTASLFGTVPSVLIGGIGTLVVVVLAWKAFPALFRADSFRAQVYRDA